MSVSGEEASDQRVKEKTDELRVKYPIFTAIVERIPVMDLKEVVSLLSLVDPVRSIYYTVGQTKRFHFSSKILIRVFHFRAYSMLIFL
jgi:hypothetical protein